MLGQNPINNPSTYKQCIITALSKHFLITLVQLVFQVINKCLNVSISLTNNWSVIDLTSNDYIAGNGSLNSLYGL